MSRTASWPAGTAVCYSPVMSRLLPVGIPPPPPAWHSLSTQKTNNKNRFRQTTVTAHFSSKQLLLFAFAICAAMRWQTAVNAHLSIKQILLFANCFMLCKNFLLCKDKQQ